MFGKFIVTLLAFVLFIYIFWFKLIKKNDTNYIIILGIEAIGILINYIQIFFKIMRNGFFNFVVFVFAILVPVCVFIVEYKNINVSEWMYVLMAKVYLLFGNDKKAKEILIELTKAYPDSYWAHKILAEIYEKEGGMRRAIEEYVKTLELRRNDYKSYYKISVLLKDLGRDKQAILMLNNLLKVKPEHYQATQMLSELLLKSGDYKKTISFINKALKTHPDDEDLIYNLGIAYAKLNEFDLAKKCFEEVVSLNNQNHNAFYRLGQIALLYRDFDMAEKHFLSSAYEEKEAKAYFELTKIYMLTNQKDKAILTIEKAINADNKYYKIAKEEPILIPIKNAIKPATELTEKNLEESKKETMIEDYLSDTYNLTKVLSDKEENNNKQVKKHKKN